MKQILSLLLVLALTLALAGCGSQTQESIDLGKKYLSEENYEEAIRAFTEALEIDPKSAAALEGRGDAYAAQGDYAAAAADYAQAAEHAQETLRPALAEKLTEAEEAAAPVLEDVLAETGELALIKNTIAEGEAAAQETSDDAEALAALVAACDRAHALSPKDGYDAQALLHSEALYRLGAFDCPQDYLLLAERYLAAGRDGEAAQVLDAGIERFGEAPLRPALRQLILTDKTADAQTADALAAIYERFAAGDTDGVYAALSSGLFTEDCPKRCYTVEREAGVMKCGFSASGGVTDGKFWFLSSSELQLVWVDDSGKFISGRAVYTDGVYNGPFFCRTNNSDTREWHTISGTFVNGLCDGKIETVWSSWGTRSGMMSMGHTLEAQRDDVNGCIWAYGSTPDDYTYRTNADASHLFNSSSFNFAPFPAW